MSVFATRLGARTMSIENLSFQDKVKYVRMYLQISQEELSQKMGVSHATISRWERENRNPQLALLGKFYAFCRENGIEFMQEI